MTPVFQRLTKRYVNILGTLIGIAVASSILLYSACGTGRPNTPTNPTPTAPTVTSRTPAAGAVNVRVDANATVTFSEAMDPATVNVSTIELRDPASVIVPATVSYDAASNAATLDPIELLSAGTTYTARVKGGATDPRVKDVAGNALAADVTSTFTTAPPPQVLSVTPTDGAPDVLTGAAPRATFSKPLDLMSLKTSTILMQDAAGNQVPINHVYGPGTVTVAIVPQTPLQPLQTYRVILKGGADAPHITDSTGAPLPSDYTWSFTTATAPPPIMTSSIFAPTVTPAHPISDDSQSAEVGMKFRSDIDGLITAIRFYDGGPQNGEFHEGHLWASDGTRLRHANFPRETEIGWQQSLPLFPAPVPITANTTYVVSYFTGQGHYAADPGYFASTGVDNPPLHALRDGDDGGNGVIGRFPHRFPTDTIMSTNYYVDVVFSPRQSPPQVISTSPRPGAVFGVPFEPPADSPDLITFSEPIDPTTVNASTVLVTDTANKPVPFTISFFAGNYTFQINVEPSPCSSAYTVTLKGGVDAPHITSATGTPLPADYAFSYIEIRQVLPGFTRCFRG